MKAIKTCLCIYFASSEMIDADASPRVAQPLTFFSIFTAHTLIEKSIEIVGIYTQIIYQQVVTFFSLDSVYENRVY